MRIVLVLLILILFSFNVSADERFDVNIFKEDYIIGETLQAEINFSKQPLDKFSVSNLEIVDSSGSKVGVGFIFNKLNEDYYFIYGNLDLDEGDYSLRLKGLRYLENSVLVDVYEDFKFKVRDDKIRLRINPGFVILDGDFNVKIENSGSEKVMVNVSTTNDLIVPVRKSIEVEVLGIKRLFVNENDLSFDKSELVLNYDSREYKIPIFNFKEELEEVVLNESLPKEGLKFLIVVDSLDLEIDSDYSLSGPLNFKNLLNESLHDLRFSLSGNLNEIVRMNISKLDVLGGNEVKQQYLWINENKNPNFSLYEGKLILESREGYKTIYPMRFKINFVENINSEVKIEESKKEEKLEVTYEDEVREDFGLPFLENMSAEEKSVKKKRNYNVIFVIILIIVGILLFIYFKTKPKPIQQRFGDFIKGYEK